MLLEFQQQILIVTLSFDLTPKEVILFINFKVLTQNSQRSSMRFRQFAFALRS
jgi:hypothetical protein